MQLPIIDLHCDLLLYLEGGKQRTACDLSARCAIPQLRDGNVRLQIMAIFAETGPDSSEKGWSQVLIYQELPFKHPKEFVHFFPSWDRSSSRIAILPAIENA